MVLCDDIEKLVKESGLYPYERWQLNEFPPELHAYCGRGLGLWQYPNQFSAYLDFLLTRFPSTRTYAEIGVAAGGTFMFTTNFLRKYGHLQKSYAVDVAEPGRALGSNGPSPYDNLLADYLKTNQDICIFLKGTSHTLRSLLLSSNTTLDVAFIDGDHSYSGVQQDYENLKDLARVLVFHDIASDVCPGVKQFWKEIVATHKYETHEFTQQYNQPSGSFLGIGVAIRL